MRIPEILVFEKDPTAPPLRLHMGLFNMTDGQDKFELRHKAVPTYYISNVAHARDLLTSIAG